MKQKFEWDALDLTAFLNGLVFFAPVSLLVRTTAGVSLRQFFILQAVLSSTVLLAEIPSGWLTDRIGYRATLVLYQATQLAARVLLLAAWLSRSFALFVAQAVLEGVAAGFYSGTQSAYLYSMVPLEQYAAKTAHVANCGTLGFFASTLAYAGLYTATGLRGLLLATVAANALAVPVSMRIPRERRAPQAAARQAPRLRCARLFAQKKVLALLILLPALSIGRILINFFYAEKLQQCGIHAAWLTPVILGYSAIELLAEGILVRTPGARHGALFGRCLVLGGGVLVLLGTLRSPLGVVPAMLLLPLLLDVPSYLLDEAQNQWVDAAGLGQNRAELLSVFNMGVNVTEIVFLLGSAAVASAGSAVCFWLLGLFLAAAGLVARRLGQRGRGFFADFGR